MSLMQILGNIIDWMTMSNDKLNGNDDDNDEQR